MKIEKLLDVLRIEGIDFSVDENFDGSVWVESKKGVYVFRNEKIKFMRKKVLTRKVEKSKKDL